MLFVQYATKGKEEARNETKSDCMLREGILVLLKHTHTHITPVSSEEEWQGIVASKGLDSVQLRDKRYDQVVHMVTAANGAEQFYQSSNNPTRWEGLQLAREQDSKAAEVGNTFL